MAYGSGFENNRSERWKKQKKRKILQRSKHNYVLESFAYVPMVPMEKEVIMSSSALSVKCLHGPYTFHCLQSGQQLSVDFTGRGRGRGGVRRPL